jgi:NTP pyrophosphatase (non-canonical NTP hydrolase)
MNNEKYFAILKERDRRLFSHTEPIGVLVGMSNADFDAGFIDTGNPLRDAILKIEHDLNAPHNWGDEADSVSLNRAEAEAVVAALKGNAAPELTNEFDRYQQKALSTAIYRGRGSYQGLSYVTIKLGGECGEFSDKVGKAWRDDDGAITPERRKALALELGDVCWYVAAAADELGFKLSEIIELNLEKLAQRRARGTLSGDGDDR